MKGWRFEAYVPQKEGVSSFDQLLKIFKDLLIHTSGDVSEALSWLTELDRQYNLIAGDYSIAEFIDELKSKGLISENGDINSPDFIPTSKMETSLRRYALDNIFDQLKKSKKEIIIQSILGKEMNILLILEPMNLVTL